MIFARWSFTDANKDRFGNETFDFIATYLENSLTELAARNPGVETSFKRVNANEFTATVYTGDRKASWRPTAPSIVTTLPGRAPANNAAPDYPNIIKSPRRPTQGPAV
jgi:hypothetical protein